MAITPGAGWMVDPTNPNKVVPIGSLSTVNNPNTQGSAVANQSIAYGATNPQPQTATPSLPPPTPVYKPPVANAAPGYSAPAASPTQTMAQTQATMPTPTYSPPNNTPGTSSDELLKQYLSNLAPTADETKYQGELANLEASRKLSFQNLEGQPIATSFITGQEAAVGKALDNSKQTLTQQLALAQSKRQSAMDVSKAALDYTTNSAGKYTTAPAGSTIYNTTTGTTGASTPTLTQQNQSSSGGQSAADIAMLNANQAAAAKLGVTIPDAGGGASTGTSVPAATTTTLAGLQGGKTLVSGQLQYAPTDYKADEAALIKSRGSDGWVDPQIYLNLYNAWVKKGGLRSDFLKTYPPTNYINPANTWPQIVALGGGTKPKAATKSSSNGAQLP
jgi:hypothetical protein